MKKNKNKNKKNNNDNNNNDKNTNKNNCECEGPALFFANGSWSAGVCVCVPVHIARSLGIEIFAHIVEPAGPSRRRTRTRTRTTTTITITRASVGFTCLHVVFFFPLPLPFTFSSVPFLLFDPSDSQIIGKIQYFGIFLSFYDPGFFFPFFSLFLFFDSSHLCFSSVHILGNIWFLNFLQKLDY